MARDYGCKVVALVSSDGAWDHDPFAASPDYRLAEQRADPVAHLRRHPACQRTAVTQYFASTPRQMVSLGARKAPSAALKVGRACRSFLSRLMIFT